MPCYGVRETVQTLENITDLKALALGLEEMGFTVAVNGNAVFFNGKVQGQGRIIRGSYSNGRLASPDGIDLAMVAKYAAIGNIKRQIELNNKDKYKKTKLTLTKKAEFKYVVTKNKKK